MKRNIIIIVLIVIIAILMVILCLKLPNINNDTEGQINIENYNLADKLLDSFKSNNYEGYKEVIIKNFLEIEETKDILSGNDVYANLNKIEKNGERYIAVVPAPDFLYSYDILEQTVSHPGIISVFAQGKGEEVYRAYIYENKIIKIKNMETEIFENITDSKYNKEKLIELYDYYVNF